MENLSIVDLRGLDHLEIMVSLDGKTVWINDEKRCLFRAQEIKNLVIRDDRK